MNWPNTFAKPSKLIRISSDRSLIESSEPVRTSQSVKQIDCIERTNSAEWSGCLPTNNKTTTNSCLL